MFKEHCYCLIWMSALYRSEIESNLIRCNVSIRGNSLAFPSPYIAAASVDLNTCSKSWTPSDVLAKKNLGFSDSDRFCLRETSAAVAVLRPKPTSAHPLKATFTGAQCRIINMYVNNAAALSICRSQKPKAYRRERIIYHFAHRLAYQAQRAAGFPPSARRGGIEKQREERLTATDIFVIGLVIRV